MKVPFFDLKRQYESLKSEIDSVMLSVLSHGWFIGGDVVEQFETNFAGYAGGGHCIGCGSGTDALELILRGFDIGPGDEVIVPAFSWISDAEVVTLVGARVVFADVLPDTFTIDPWQLEKAITPKTKAVIAVHLYGMPCRMDEIMVVAQKHGVKVIEDCAQAPGAVYRGRKVGSVGDAAAFSFYPTKNLGAYGDGGAVITHDESLAARIRLISNHGQSRRDVHLIEGRNSRLDVIQAALLDVKLKCLDPWNERRREIAAMYNKKLKSVEIQLSSVPEDVSHVFHLYVIRTAHRDRLQKFLAENGIMTAIHYPKALHQLPAYAYLSLNDGEFPVASGAAAEVLSLPVFPELRDEEVEKITAVVNEFQR